MTTTALIAEVLVIGFVAIIWLLLTLLRFSQLDFAGLIKFAEIGFSKWPIIQSMLMIAVVYQLGLMVNWFTAALVKHLFMKKWRDPIFENKSEKTEKKRSSYQMIRAQVLTKCSTEFVNDLYVDLSIIRLSRGATLNFFLIGIILIFFKKFMIALLMIFISIICFLQFRNRFQKYYNKILCGYEVTNQNNNNK